MCPMFSGHFGQTRNMHFWMAGDNLNQMIASQCECASGKCVCALRRPDLTLWLLGWGRPFFCQRKWKVRNSILYWFTEMRLPTLTYYYWPYNSHPPKGVLLLHIFIHQLHVWFSLSGSTGFLLMTDMCLGWIGDSKLTSGVNVSANACSPSWPCDELKAHSGSRLLPKGSWAWLQPPPAL